MNDDLHKTFEPESVPDDLVNNGNLEAGGWSMPEPVFRRSSGRAARPPANETQKAPTTFVPARMAKKNADQAPSANPSPEVEPQPSLAEHFNTEEEIVLGRDEEASADSKLHFGLAAVVLLAMIGIGSALLIAIYLGFIVWR